MFLFSLEISHEDILRASGKLDSSHLDAVQLAPRTREILNSVTFTSAELRGASVQPFFARMVREPEQTP